LRLIANLESLLGTGEVVSRRHGRRGTPRRGDGRRL